MWVVVRFNYVYFSEGKIYFPMIYHQDHESHMEQTHKREKKIEIYTT